MTDLEKKNPLSPGESAQSAEEKHTDQEPSRKKTSLGLSITPPPRLRPKGELPFSTGPKETLTARLRRLARDFEDDDEGPQKTEGNAEPLAMSMRAKTGERPQAFKPDSQLHKVLPVPQVASTPSELKRDGDKPTKRDDEQEEDWEEEIPDTDKISAEEISSVIEESEALFDYGHQDLQSGPKTTLLMHRKHEAPPQRALRSPGPQRQGDSPKRSVPEKQGAHEPEDLEDATQMLSLKELEEGSAALEEKKRRTVEPEEFQEEKTQLSPSLSEMLAQDSNTAEAISEIPLARDLSEPTNPEDLPPLAARSSRTVTPIFETAEGAPPAKLSPSGKVTNHPSPPFSERSSGPAAQRNPAQEVPSGGFRSPPPQQEEDDDFDGLKTEVFSSPFESDPICPRLTVLEGPSAGQDFLINRMRNSVGRATNNAVVIPDLSMSRKHFEVVQQSDETFAVKDLVSVNGTSLNGVRIKEADLFHGDRIEAGGSTFQFVIPGDVPVDSRQRRLIPAANTRTASARPVEALGAAPLAQPGPSPLTDRILMGVTIGAALLCIPLLFFLVSQALVSDTEPPPAVSAQELYFQGVSALQERNWDQAEEFFKESFTVDSQFGDVPAQIDRINRERRGKRILTRAREAEGPLGEAMISELRSISVESAYYDQAQGMLRLARQNQAHELLTEAHQAYEKGEREEAERLLEALFTLSPHHEGGLRLRQAMADGVAVEAPRPEPTTREAPAAPSVARQGTTTRPASGTRTDTLADPFAEPARSTQRATGAPSAAVNFTEGFTLYRAERFDESITHFESIASTASGALSERASTAARDVRRFRDALRTAEVHLGGGRFAQARSQMDAARAADESVAGGQGYFEERLTELRARSYAMEGLSRIERGNYTAAFELLRQAELLAPRESTTRQLSRALEAEANSLYIRAANQRLSDPEGAAELCRQIMTIVPPSSENYRRARQMLDEL